MFALHADKYQPHTWFYVMSKDVIKNELDRPPNDTAVFVYKEDGVYFFDGINS